MTDHPMYQGVKFPEADIDGPEASPYPKMKYMSHPEFPETPKAGTHYKIVNNEEEEAEFDKKYLNVAPFRHPNINGDVAPAPKAAAKAPGWDKDAK